MFTIRNFQVKLVELLKLPGQDVIDYREISGVEFLELSNREGEHVVLGFTTPRTL